MNARATIADACEEEAIALLNHALRVETYKSRQAAEDDRRAITEAHRLLECATMLRSDRQ